MSVIFCLLPSSNIDSLVFYLFYGYQCGKGKGGGVRRFWMNVISPETRMMGLPCGEEIMIVGRTMWTQSTSVTDRRTDRRTDGRTDRITITDTVQRIASHGKK